MTSCTNSSTASLGVVLSISAKRGLVHTHSYENKFTFACDLNDNLFSYERISTRTHFEKKGGLHVVWKLLDTANCVRFAYFLSKTSSRQSRNLQLTRPSQQEEKHFWVSDLISAMGGHPRNITQQKQF